MSNPTLNLFEQDSRVRAEIEKVWFTFAELVQNNIVLNKKTGEPQYKDAYSFWRCIADPVRSLRRKLDSYITTEEGISPEEREIQVKGILILDDWQRSIDYDVLNRMLIEKLKLDDLVESKPEQTIDVSSESNEFDVRALSNQFERLYYSQDEFPVDFDLAWQWIGYTRKDNAKRALVKDFVENLDYISLNIEENSVGRPSERIMLTIDCFKQFCMMAGTPQGKEVRLYYLECEKKLKAIVNAEPAYKDESLAPMQRQMDILTDDVAGLQDGQNRILEMLNGMEEDRKAESKLNRENFPKAVKDAVRRYYTEKHKAKCLITGEVLFKDGMDLPNAVHWHHINNDASDNGMENAWPLSPEGHRIIHNKKERKAYEKAEAMWKAEIEFLADKINQDKPVQASLFQIET